MKANDMRILILIGCLLWATTAAAQNPPVIQTGPITPGHAMQWNSNGVAQDAGPATNGTLTSLGVTNNGGPGICINSARITAPFNQLCFAVSTGAAAQISLQNYGGAPAQTLIFNLNGASYQFPFSLGGIMGPNSSTVGDLAVWNNTAGTLLKDFPLKTGSFTLNASATSTIVTVAGCTAASVVLLSPATQDAANDMATTSIVPGAGQFVVTHANNARVDRTFGYVLVGG